MDVENVKSSRSFLYICSFSGCFSELDVDGGS